MDINDLITDLSKDLHLSNFDRTLILRRTKYEGFSFLSKTLPKVSSFLLASVEAGSLNRGDLTHFKWKGGFPIFLGSLFERIFLPCGKLRDDACPHAIHQIRQVCEYFYKLVVDDSTDGSTSDFLKVDQEVADAYDANYVEQLRKFFATHYKSIHDSHVEDVFRACSPNFGPGTFADKGSYPIWYFRRSSVEGAPRAFRHYWSFFHTKAFNKYLPSVKPVCEDVDWNELLFVPKDSRGPRVIIREPGSILRAQMSYNRYVSRLCTKISNGRINFTSQDINKDLARESSISREWSTIDLSSASDRVGFKCVKHLFRYSPLLPFVLSSTRKCKLPDGSIHKLNKLSGMGSGLTFPTMSLLIHLTITFALSKHGIPFYKAKNLVYVYGDDIIVPTRFYGLAVKSLTRLGLRVNESKSFYRSHFRESCGGDYFKGYSVTPVRLRMSSAGISVSNGKVRYNKNCSGFYLLQLERHCRELVVAGYMNLARFYYREIERRLGTKLPSGSGSTSALVRYRNEPSEVIAVCDSTGTYKDVKVFVPVPVRDSRWKTFESSPYYDSHRAIYSAVTRSSRYNSYTWYEKLLVADSSASSPGVVPRRIRLEERSLSSLSLVG